MNANRVGIVTGAPGGTYIRLAHDLASLLDQRDGHSMRILPVSGRGSLQNIVDLLYLNGIDIAIVQSDVLYELQANRNFPDIENGIRYITRLHQEEIHILASGNVPDLFALSGKRVNAGGEGSGTRLTARLLFQLLGITPTFTNYSEEQALAHLQEGSIDAMVYVVGKPASLFRGINAEGVAKHGLRFLSIPETESLRFYEEATLTSSDYPNLIPEKEDVRTRSVNAVMAVFNWRPGQPRYRAVERFIDQFFSRFNELTGPGYSEKWRQVQIDRPLPKWQRFAVAEQWMHKGRPSSGAADPCQAAFLRELAGKGITPQDLDSAVRDQMFSVWRSNQPDACR